MRIGFDISPLQGGHAGRGTGTYTRLLLEGLKAHSRELEIVEFETGESVPTNIDLVHYPYFDPFLLTLPRRYSTLSLVTVHDLIPIKAATHFPRGIRGEIKWQIQRRSLQQCAAIITDSEASKIDIVSLVPYDRHKISVIYLAPGTEFVPQSENNQDRIRKKYHLPQKFVLYVGDINWNKNILGLLKAMAQVDVPLFCVGKAFLNEDLQEVQEINTLIQSQQLNDKIVKLGFVPADDLPALYSAASVYVQPSFLEGFGLPVLEAMACGTPAVVSNAASLVEIAGPSVLVQPDNPSDIAKGIILLLQKDKRQMQSGTIAWSKKFTWEKTVLETINVYKKIIGSTEL